MRHHSTNHQGIAEQHQTVFSEDSMHLPEQGAAAWNVTQYIVGENCSEAFTLKWQPCRNVAVSKRDTFIQPSLRREPVRIRDSVCVRVHTHNFAAYFFDDMQCVRTRSYTSDV